MKSLRNLENYSASINASTENLGLSPRMAIFSPSCRVYESKAAISLGSNPQRIIRKVILPSALPMIFAGLKLGIGIALLLVVAAEMIAADAGIGFLILTSADLMQTTKLMFGISILSMLGLIFSWLIDRLEKLCIPWKK